MKLKQCYHGLCVLYLFLFGIIFSFNANAQEIIPELEPLTIAISSDYPPLTVLTPNGEPTGLLVEMWKLWSEATNRPVHFRVTDWEGTFEGLRQGAADVHSGLFRNDERAQWIDFSEPVHEIKTGLFFKSNGLSPQPLQTMAGKKVGAINGFYQLDYLKENYADIEAKGYPNGKALVLGILDGEVDAILNEIPSVEADLARFALRGSLTHGGEIAFTNLVFAGVRKGETELLAQINEGFEKIPVAKLARLETLWLTDTSSHYYLNAEKGGQLTAREEEWLLSHPVIRMGVTTFIKPIDIVDKEGNFSGLNADLITLLNQKLGTNIVPEFHDKWGDVVDNVMTGKIDAALSLSRTPERERHVLFTRPYAFDPIIVVVPQQVDSIHTWEDLRDKKIVAVKGMAVMGEIEKTLGNGTLTLVETEVEALKVLERKEAEAFVGFLLPYGNAQRSYPAPRLKIAITRNTEGGSLRIGVPKTQPELYSILRKGLKTITRDELSVIRNRWFYPKNDSNALDVRLNEEERAWLSDHSVIRIGVDTAYPPFEFINDEGKYLGIAPEYLKLMGERLGIEFKVVPGLSWQQVLDGTKNRTVDMVPVITDTEERRKYLNFTQVYLPTSTVIFTRSDFPEIRSLAGLAGKRIAYPTGFSEILSIKKNHPTIEIIEVPNLLDAIKAVASGKVDATQANLTVMGYLLQENNITNIKVAAPADNKDTGMSMGARKDWPELIPILEKALTAITREESQAIRRNWVDATLSNPALPLVDLSLEERQWLEQHGTFKLGVDPAWAPFEFFDDKGVYSGIGSGYVDMVGDRLGIQLKAQPNLSWSEVMEKAQSGELDIVPTLVRTREREKFLNFSNPYISFPMVITTRKDASFVDSLAGLNGKKVGVVKGYATQELIEANHKNIITVPTQTLAEGLQQLNDGKIDAFVDNLVTITYEIDHSGLNNLKIAAPTKYKFELAMGVRKDLPELIPILNKALETISERERSAIVNSWTAIQVSYGVDTKTILLWVIPIAIGGIVIIIVVVFWVRYIQKQRRIIQRNEKRLSSIIETVPDGIIVIDGKGIIQTFSPAAEKIFGYASDDILGKNVSLLMPKAMAVYHDEYLSRYEVSGESQIIGTVREVEGQNENGDLFPLDLTIGESKIDSNTFYTASIRDITERKKAEEVLRINQQLLESIIENSSSLIFSKNLDGFYTLVNKRWENYTGFSQNEAVGKTDFDIFPESLARIICGNDKKIIQGGVTTELEEVAHGETGTRTFLSQKIPLLDADGNVNGICGISTDITERKEAEQELARIVSSLNAIMDGIDYGILFMDSDLRINVCNAAFKEMWGVEDEFISAQPTMEDYIRYNQHKGVYNVKDEDFDDFVTDRIAKVRAGSIPPTEIVRRDGRTFIYQNIVLQSGGSMLTYFDITERKNAENKLNDAFDVISSSINYASRIQRSILPPQHFMNEDFQDHFTIWEPRDIVGGDMYWYVPWGEGQLALLGDCTGHGVPGAFMTLISNGAINLALSEVPPGDPAKLLQRMHQMIQENLGQNIEEGDSDDGLEVGACYMQQDQKSLTFAGAKFTLFISDHGEINEIKGDKSGLGYRGIAHDVPFTNHIVENKPNRKFYMTSDGLIDQVGGERNRGFGKKRFKSLLTSISELSMVEQKASILEALTDYQGDQIRRDDISLLGFIIGPNIKATAYQIENPLDEAFIKFDDSLSVGFIEIDEDHKTIIELTNKFHSYIAKDDTNGISQTLNELASYVAWHFKHEERLMQSHRYPGYEEHLSEHDKLASSVAEIKGKFDSGDKSVLVGLPDFLKDWLIHHIQVTDKKLGKFLNDVAN